MTIMVDRVLAAERSNVTTLNHCFGYGSRSMMGTSLQSHSRLPEAPFFVALLVATLLAFFALPAHGQSFGTINGDIVDPSGAVVPAAKVTATEAETGFSREVVSDSHGHYIIPNLRPTQYTLTVQGTGFQKFVQENVSLLANQVATVDVKLQLGSPVQTVVVNEAAPLVNTTTQTLSDVIERDRIVDCL